MSPDPQSKSSDKFPLWIIAFSLLTIAICLVALVFRSSTGRDPEATTAGETQVREGQNRELTVRVMSPARARVAGPEVGEADSAGLSVESPTQTVVQTSQTIVITPPLRGLALGAKKQGESDLESNNALGGTITGRAILEGEPPAERVFTVPALAGCEHLVIHPPTTHDYVLGTNRGLANVFLQLVPMPSPGPKIPTSANLQTVTLTLTNCDLQPYLVALFPTDRLELRNASSLPHVLEFRRREDLSPFVTVPLEPGMEFSEKGFAFVSSGLRTLSVRCALHEWEQSRVAVTKEPHFTITDANGRFAFSNVPPYLYRLEVFHWPSLTPINSPRFTSDINLFTGATVVRNLRINPPR